MVLQLLWTHPAAYEAVAEAKALAAELTLNRAEANSTAATTATATDADQARNWGSDGETVDLAGVPEVLRGISIDPARVCATAAY